jgi:hypothetical protein
LYLPEIVWFGGFWVVPVHESMMFHDADPERKLAKCHNVAS